VVTEVRSKEEEYFMDDVGQYLSMLAEEYKSLRDESKQASINMFAALRWGAAVLGVVIVAGFAQWNKQHDVVLLIFYVVVPILSGMSMFLWLGEAARFKRVGDYICLIEQKAGMILDEFKSQYGIKGKWGKLQVEIEKNLSIQHSVLDMSDPLSWEQWLRDMKGKSITEGHLSLIYLIRLAFFPLTMFFSLFTATYYVLTHPKFIPPLLFPLERFIPETKTGVLILIVAWLVIFTFFMLIAGIIAWRLNVKTKPTIRTLSETK